MIDGFIVVDKPAGITSHDVVAILRRTLHQKKIGHTGTLDPFATGVLPVALGEGTKTIPYLDESIKEYQTVMCLGISTDTLDFTGTVISTRDWSHLNPEHVRAVFTGFVGSITQVPPMYSAIKQGGIPLYKLARKGETVERKERQVVVSSLVIDRIELPHIAFTIRCSKGTYVRTLVDDIGEALGVGAHVTELRRTASGSFRLADAVKLDELASDHLLSRLISVRNSLDFLPELYMNDNGCKRLRNGIAPSVDDLLPDCLHHFNNGQVKLIHNNVLQAIAEVSCAGSSFHDVRFKLMRVFNLLYSLQ